MEFHQFKLGYLFHLNAAKSSSNQVKPACIHHYEWLAIHSVQIQSINDTKHLALFHEHKISSGDY